MILPLSSRTCCSLIHAVLMFRMVFPARTRPVLMASSKLTVEMALISDKMRDRSRDLRRNQTDVERRLWRTLKARQVNGWRFRRQHPVEPYIADFACHAKRIIVEVDGSQHGPRSAADEERTKVLQAHGYQVLRYWNNDVLTNIDGVLEDILSKINSDPHP